LFLRYNKLGILWTLFVLLLCGLPGNQFEGTHSFVGFDKLLHALLFGTLSILLIVGFLKQDQMALLRKRAILISVVFSVLYGILIEVLQGTVFVDRAVEPDDALANAVGAVAGMGVFYAVYGKVRPIRSR